MLADEPTANLDSKTGEQIISLMKKINRELATTFIFSTHDAKIVGIADHVIRLRDGEVVENTRNAALTARWTGDVGSPPAGGRSAMPVLIRIALRNIREHTSKSLIIGSLVVLGVIIIVLGNSLLDTAEQGVHRMFIDNYTGDVFISGIPDHPRGVGEPLRAARRRGIRRPRPCCRISTRCARTCRPTRA